ncbi:MAG: creatininase family protein, partial [Chloroflexi bacterium]
MTAFFAYEELTWPEVNSLPRDTPLIIPLGNGYPLEQLSSALSFPSSIGLLPPVPFGWRGSGLAVSDEVFQRYLLNLIESLRDDGFSRTFVLTPQGLDWNSSPVESGLGASRISLPLSSTHQSSLPGDDQRGKVILLPVGHTEQHGYHLPLSTDTLIIDAVSKGTANKVPNDAFCLPVMPYGVSTHRSSFPGTLNAGGRAFEDFWLNVINVLAARGFDRFFFLSGHGGNVSFLVNIVKYAGERHKRIFCATCWLYLSGPEGIK